MGYFTDGIRLPSAKFPSIGTEVAGQVVEIGTSPVPDFDDRGRPSGNRIDNEGHAIMQVDVTLEHDGIKTVLHTDGGVFYAIGRGLAEIGAEDLEVGDHLSVTYDGDGEPTAKGRNAPKQYKAIVTKA